MQYMYRLLVPIILPVLYMIQSKKRRFYLLPATEA